MNIFCGMSLKHVSLSTTFLLDDGFMTHVFINCNIFYCCHYYHHHHHWNFHLLCIFVTSKGVLQWSDPCIMCVPNFNYIYCDVSIFRPPIHGITWYYSIKCKAACNVVTVAANKLTFVHVQEQGWENGSWGQRWHCICSSKFSRWDTRERKWASLRENENQYTVYKVKLVAYNMHIIVLGTQ